MADSNYNDAQRATAPATKSQAFVNANPPPATAPGCTLYVGTAGDLVVDLRRDADGTKTKFKNVAVGPFSMRVKKIYGPADGTTAADIVMVW